MGHLSLYNNLVLYHLALVHLVQLVWPEDFGD